MRRHGDPDAALVADEAGDLKKGTATAGASATERSDAARGPLTSVSLVCLVASAPEACRSGA